MTIVYNPFTDNLDYKGTSGGGGTVTSLAVQTGTSPVTAAAGVITLNGAVVAAGTNPIRTDGTGANTAAVEVQISQAIAAADATKIGLSNYDSSSFGVTATGFVTLATTGAGKTITGTTGGALSPTANNWNILAGTVAAGITPIATSGAASTLTINVQKSQAIAAADTTKIGLSNYSNTDFAVDSTGFVTLSTTGAAKTITGTSGGALSPTANNWNILGASTVAGTSPVNTSGSGSTLTVNVQKSQAIASADATKVGLANFDSTSFAVDANGFVTASGTGVLKTLTGNTGGALSPTAGNINVIGTGSVTVAGSGSTLTTQLTGLTNHALQVGAGTATLTQLASGTTGQVLQTNTSADPTWSTATYPSTTTINQILYSSATNTVSELSTANDGVLITSNTGVPSFLANGTTGQVLLATTGSPPSWGSPPVLSFIDQGTSTTLAVNKGYYVTAATTQTLPAAPSQGDLVIIDCDTSGAVVVTANTGQLIRIGSSISSTAGTLTSTAQGDALTLRYRASGTTWQVISSMGNWTPA